MGGVGSVGLVRVAVVVGGVYFFQKLIIGGWGGGGGANYLRFESSGNLTCVVNQRIIQLETIIPL